MNFLKKSCSLLSCILIFSLAGSAFATEIRITSSENNNIKLSDNENPEGMSVNATSALTLADLNQILYTCHHRGIHEILFPFILSLAKDCAKVFTKNVIKTLNSAGEKIFVEINYNSMPFCNPTLTIQDIMNFISPCCSKPMLYKNGGIKIYV